MLSFLLVERVLEKEVLNDQVEVVVCGHVISVDEDSEYVKYSRLLPLKIRV